MPIVGCLEIIQAIKTNLQVKCPDPRDLIRSEDGIGPDVGGVHLNLRIDFDTNDKLLRGYLFFRVLQVMHRDDLLHPTFLDKSRTI